MKSKIYLLIIFIVFSFLAFGQSIKHQKHRAKIVAPDQMPQNVLPSKNMSRISANQIGFTDYDYAGNSTVNEMVWPYDIDGDGIMDPVGTFMQRSTANPIRKNVFFVGLEGQFATLDASYPERVTGWGVIQSITEGPWAGYAAIAGHQGGANVWTVFNLTDFSTLIFHATSDVFQNFPSFAYLDDGTVYHISTDAIIRKSDASTILTSEFVPVTFGIPTASSENPIRRSPNGEYLAVVADDGFQYVYLYTSNNAGETWVQEVIGEQEVSPIVNRPGLAPLFVNFGQRSYAIDNNGIVHVGFNGYSINNNIPGGADAFPALYWNSNHKQWIAISDEAEEGSELITYYPGNGSGNAYPTPVVSEDGSVVVVMYQAPEYDNGVLQLYPGDGGVNSYENYYTDIKYAVSENGGASFAAPIVAAGNSNESDAFPSAYDWLIQDGNEYTIHFMYLTDAIPGVSLFSENSASDDSYWNYETLTFSVVPTWQADINVFDSADRAGLTLTFGQKVSATDGLDIGLGESELPPNPPTGAFDARFLFPDNVTASIMDYRNIDDETAEWILQFQPGAAGYPIRLSWDPNNFSIDGYWRLVDVINGSFVNEDMTAISEYVVENEAIDKLKITYSTENCIQVPYSNGWNILSIPNEPADNSVNQLFPNAGSNAFQFNGGYSIADQLTPGEGYWLKFNEAGSVLVCGNEPENTVNVSAGWNMIGVFGKSVFVENLSSTPAEIITSNIFAYNQSGYQLTDKLGVGKGFWVKVNQDGVIQFDVAEKGNTKNNFGIDEHWAKVQFEDNLNNRSQLYFSRENIGGKGDMPPKPPVGIFDVRFSGDKFVELSNDEWKTLEVSNAVFPITLRSLNENLELKIINGESEEIISLSKNEPFTISNPHSSIQLKIMMALPYEFSLEQNYPNPFNPTTTIKFSLPSELKVSLDIYNVLGQKVMELINGNVPAGEHIINFDAGKLSSGVYFYRINAGNFSQVKKMMIMK